jgi:hypothetical protein
MMSGAAAKGYGEDVSGGGGRDCGGCEEAMVFA